MLTPITVNYQPDGDDWKVSVTQDDKSLTGRAPGLIAARDTADQLVEKLAPKDQDSSAKAPVATVVHLLEGDPVAFTTAYLHARHGGLAGAPTEESRQQPGETESRETESGETESAETESAETESGPAPDQAASDETASDEDWPGDSTGDEASEDPADPAEAAVPEQDSAQQDSNQQDRAKQDNAVSASEQDASEAVDAASDDAAALATPSRGGSAHGAQEAAALNGSVKRTADGQTVVAADDAPEPAALS